MIRRGEGGWADVGRALMVARVLVPVLTCGAMRPHPTTGRPSRPSLPRSTTLAPTDVDELFVRLISN